MCVALAAVVAAPPALSRPAPDHARVSATAAGRSAVRLPRFVLDPPVALPPTMMLRRPIRTMTLTQAATPTTPTTPAPSVPEPPGYRMTDFRAPVPATLAGARVVDTAGAEALWRGGARFVDVLPRPPRPDLPPRTLWRPPVRDNIPGSVWLVNTGFGALSPEAEAYLAAGLAKATDGDRAAALVFYCMTDCWMSWNAARRALAAGYRNVVWYPYGTDGWAAAGLPLVRAEPEPGEPVHPD